MPVRLTVYFNGACNICAPEVALYRRRTQAHGRAHVSYFDISSADLPASLPAGTLRDDMLRRLHIQKVMFGIAGLMHLSTSGPKCRVLIGWRVWLACHRCA